MGDWSYLSLLLDKVQSHSTVVGKVWMSVLFLFRILILGAAADSVWGDEHSDFECNNNEPGCQHACYNWLFPISYIRYWIFQIVFVTLPTLIYLAHAIHVIHREKRLREKLQSQEATGGAAPLKRPKYTDDRGKVQIKGVLLRSYLIQLVAKIILEVAFIVGQYYLYGSIVMVAKFHCQENPPCPVSIGVECFISRPTEKTIFIIFMLAVAGVSVLLNIVEIFYLLCARRKAAEKKLMERHYLANSQPLEPRASVPSYAACLGNRNVQGYPLAPLPQGLIDICQDDSCIDLVDKEKHN